MFIRRKRLEYSFKQAGLNAAKYFTIPDNPKVNDMTNDHLPEIAAMNELNLMAPKPQNPSLM